MDPLLSIRRLGVITALTVFATVPIRAQDAHPDRFGLGVSGITGSFGGDDAALPGIEGFVRVARGSFWNARVDGAYYGRGQRASACLGGDGGCVATYIDGLGTLIATLAFGPNTSSGLRPFYGLLGVGGVAIRSRGGSCSLDVTHCGPGVALALVEAGVGSEFHALGGNRIELRIHNASRSLGFGRSGDHGAVGASLALGVVW